MKGAFRDHFSKQARQYSKHRPAYPDALFEYLADLAPERKLAWDCGTGNGQAALKLARRFERVIATDASADQIRHAVAAHGVEYRAEPAEQTSLGPKSVDLITVGTAVHWFEFEPFYEEVRRVSREAAILAVWTYHLPKVSPAVDAWLEGFFRNTLAGYWPDRITYLDERYRTIPFPFEEIPTEPFSMTTRWDFKCFEGFLASWSGSMAFCERNGVEAFRRVMQRAATAWGERRIERTIAWDLYCRIGRVFVSERAGEGGPSGHREPGPRTASPG